MKQMSKLDILFVHPNTSKKIYQGLAKNNYLQIFRIFKGYI